MTKNTFCTESHFKTGSLEWRVNCEVRGKRDCLRKMSSRPARDELKINPTDKWRQLLLAGLTFFSGSLVAQAAFFVFQKPSSDFSVSVFSVVRLVLLLHSTNSQINIQSTTSYSYSVGPWPLALSSHAHLHLHTGPSAPNQFENPWCWPSPTAATIVPKQPWGLYSSLWDRAHCSCANLGRFADNNLWLLLLRWVPRVAFLNVSWRGEISTHIYRLSITVEFPFVRRAAISFFLDPVPFPAHFTIYLPFL